MFTLNSKGRMRVVDKPWVMGILNLTPDSFYPGSRVSHSQLIDVAGSFLEQGADILDLGGQSTRPGSDPLSAEAEMERVIPAFTALRKAFPDCWLSVDTFHATVAEAAVEAGADWVNDISGGYLDAAMLSTVGRLQVPYICMHMKGTPQTMQQQAQYEQVTLEVLDYFIERISACRQAGIQDIIIDPGFGFAKTAAHNFQLLRELRSLAILGVPVLAGLSRKSTIYRTLGITAEEALNGTTVLNTIALLQGASLLRVHDVKEAREAITLIEAYRSA